MQLTTRRRWAHAPQSNRSRLHLPVLAIPLGFACLGAPAFGASAPEQIVGQGTAPNAFETNIPYVAWRGEQIRAVKCDSSLETAASSDVIVEEWSGTADSRPQIEHSTISRFTSSTGVPCIRFDAVTLGEGLARLKLVASDEAGRPVLKHQFLLIWMSLGTVTAKEVAANDPTGGPVGSSSEVGDPTGDGHLLAGAKNGRISVKVSGSFPDPKAPTGRTTLPNDFAALAAHYESDDQAANDPNRWDIHDNQGKGTRHRGGWCLPNGTSDDVDNCLLPTGADENGPFSNAFGQGVQAAGPFDPARPATLLSDGVLDADDAPMPAARIDVAIAPNTGQKTDIGGAGALEPADKSEIDSRDGNGSLIPHNLYAPYNQQWIPATASPKPEASGIDGPAAGNNFRGFLVDGLYDNWAIAETFESAPEIPTKCRQTIDPTSGRPAEAVSQRDGGPGEVRRIQPFGAQKVAVYTDEHGEAQVEYEPYAGGFYYDALPVVYNANGGCDLQGIDVLGRAQIQATARYPYQPVSDGPKTSNVLSKVVHSQFNKSLAYYPKGAGTDNANARIVVAHANDVDGAPFAGERVCFYVGDLADGARPFAGTTGTPDAPIMVGGTPTHTIGSAQVCRRLDDHGNAAIEVFNSDPEKVNVIAEFVDEGLLRSIDVDFGTPGTPGGGTPTPGSATTTSVLSTTAGTLPPSSSQTLATIGSGDLGGVLGIKVFKKLMVARVKTAPNGHRHLYVRVRSTYRTARITITFAGRTVKRRVITNRVVRVQNLTIPHGAKVSVKLG